MTLKVEVIEYLCDFPCPWLANLQQVHPWPRKAQTSLRVPRWVTGIQSPLWGQRLGSGGGGYVAMKKHHPDTRYPTGSIPKTVGSTQPRNSKWFEALTLKIHFHFEQVRVQGWRVSHQKETVIFSSPVGFTSPPLSTRVFAPALPPPQVGCTLHEVTSTSLSFGWQHKAKP